MPRRTSRTLSEEGLELFNVAYTHKAKPSRKKIRNYLCSIFYTKDDELIDNLTTQCRESSEHLIANLSHEDMSKWVDTFVQNIVILIMKDGDKIAKHHTAKKNFKLYLNVANKALKGNDHNTAWLMLFAFLNKSISDFNFKHAKTFATKCSTMYGNTNNCFQNHALDVYETYSSDTYIQERKYIPVAAILNMYSKKMHAYHKTYDDLGIKKEKKNKLIKIERVVRKYEKHYRSINMHNNELMPLYKTLAKVPGFENKETIAFGDLLEISKQIRQLNKKKNNRVEPEPMPALKRTEDMEWIYNPTYKKYNKYTIPN
jgi:hypothetical protein